MKVSSGTASGKIEESLKTLEDIFKETNNIVNVLQIVNNELSTLFKDFGTENIEDLLSICFGTNLVNTFITNNVDIIVVNYNGVY
jgi:hypothetical protein